MKARCVITSMNVMYKLVGGCIIGDENVYERQLEISLKPIKKEGEPGMQDTPDFLCYIKSYIEGECPIHEKGDEDILKSVKKEYNLGDIVDAEFDKAGTCVIATNLGSVPSSIERTAATNIKPYKTFFESLYSEMRRIAQRNRIIEQVNDTWIHSIEVWNLAREIGLCALRNGQELDIDFLKRATYCHDLGRMYTGSPASREIEPAYMHGLRGKNHFLNLLNDPERLVEPIHLVEAESIANVCESHMGGTGFTGITNAGLGLGNQNTLAGTIEERIIGYADWRIHPINCNGGFLPRRVSDREALMRTLHFQPNQPQIDATLNMIKYIHNITGREYGYGDPAKLMP